MIAALRRQWREDWSEIVGPAFFFAALFTFAWFALAIFNPLGG